MNLQIFENKIDLEEAIARKILSVVKIKPNACIVLTSGATPLGAYDKLVEIGTKKDFQHATILGLDEWVGMNVRTPGSCADQVFQHFIRPLELDNYFFLDGNAVDLLAECKRMDMRIHNAGGIDFMLVGLGMNGHIGLNEPGSSFDALCSITDLEEITITTAKKYFVEEHFLSKGITIGLGHLLSAKESILMVSGDSKKSILKEVMETNPSESIPATVFKLHSNGHIWADKAAGSLLPI